ncbi:hypothetical protein NNC19_22285 [Clostridium sp. SHJSY1]|uniref:hypothetical protein n=1 Tax=Clostridium sp. SHJSY1 TaxID=2942483 RepID=UPI0028770202|nr:hypothetical protein [Clostridium sp. SHJSY1]MDS0528421.1 hypothetical protein [Clostridium sp. SHJSY1]
MKDDIKVVYGNEEFIKLFELLIDNKITEIVRKVREDSKALCKNIESYPSSDVDCEADEKDE